MAKIVFASNNIAHFPGSVAGSVVGTFDATRVPYTLALSNYGLVSSPKFIPVVGDVTWIHFRTYISSPPQNIPSGSSGIMFECFDAANNLLFKMMKKSGTQLIETTSTLYNGTTSIVINNTLPMIENKNNGVDIKITVNTLLIKAEIFFNGAPVGEVSFGTNPNVLTAPNRFILGPAFTSSLAAAQHFSEILVSDTDTRNARMNLLRPAGTGAHSEWDGSLATLADDDTTSGMTTIEAGARQTMVLSPYVGAANISNFVAASMTTRGQNSPTKMKHTVRLSGVDYDSADIPLGNALEYNLTDYQLNPATSLPWVSSDLSAIESGFLSVA